jgi:hypothetical protein
MRHVTHRDADSESVIHSIFDAWYYEVLWTCALTRLLWYACHYVRLILYIMLHSTNLKSNCQMHFFPRTQMRSEVHTSLHSTVHSQPGWLSLSSKLSRYSQSHSWVCSQVHSQLHWMAHTYPAWLCTTKSTLKPLSITLLSTLSSTLPIALDCTLAAWLTISSQVSSQAALNHTPKHALKYTPNCIHWHTLSLLDCTLPSKLSRHS